MLRYLERHETSSESTNLMYMKQMASRNVSRWRGAQIARREL